MNVTLTLTFASIAELQSFLSANPAAGAAATPKVAPEQPSAEVVQMPSSAPQPTPMPTPTQDAAPAPAFDPAAKRAELTARLRATAEKMEDPSQLGAFINGFGVARFTELPDDKLPEFESQFNAKYGAA